MIYSKPPPCAVELHHYAYLPQQSNQPAVQHRNYVNNPMQMKAITGGAKGRYASYDNNQFVNRAQKMNQNADGTP